MLIQILVGAAPIGVECVTRIHNETKFEPLSSRPGIVGSHESEMVSPRGPECSSNDRCLYV